MHFKLPLPLIPIRFLDYKQPTAKAPRPEPDMDSMSDQSRAHPKPRVEDDYLVRGAGRFAADVVEPRQAYAAFVRSPHACARIIKLDIDAARAAPGVLAVLTGADMDAAGVGNIGRHPPIAGRGGKKLVLPHRPALARERVMHVGDPVAMVVAESALAAQDAAELVSVDYDPQQPVVDVRDAVLPQAPQLWPEASGNVALDWLGPAA